MPRISLSNNRTVQTCIVASNAFILVYFADESLADCDCSNSIICPFVKYQTSRLMNARAYVPGIMNLRFQILWELEVHAACPFPQSLHPESHAAIIIPPSSDVINLRKLVEIMHAFLNRFAMVSIFALALSVPALVRNAQTCMNIRLG
jgi:hypothetical protein